ncbi:M20 family metallopeptidase [uncultured Vagococcus sp.]|uniref:M20 metallopeptidase family protein n=1 Tax=uncultured Vagococcus sp. TaxID=189676 RepID=UPI0028D5F4FD|nr:M20 family metallopeptidase [uncultured Vagococcus sp.]
MNQNWENLLQEAEAFQEEMIENRRQLHRHPEVEFDLKQTVPFVMEKLTEMGYQPERCGRAGVIATIGKGGKTFLLRGDMDALPIVEDTGLPFSSTNDKMHACGHDMHTTMLLGAAKLLKAHEKEIKGTVKLMFQPAEEVMLGADDMIKAGALENPHVDAGSMIHVFPGFQIADGTVIISDLGKTMASCDWFEIHVHGKNGHGSTPERALDPLIPAANILLSLMEIQARELPADALVALTVGEFHSGNTSNVIPEHAVLKGTLRTYNDEMRVEIRERMKQIVELISETYRCQGEVLFLAGAPTLTNDEALVAHAQKVIPHLVGEEKTVLLSEVPRMSVIMGSEDFSYVSHEVPTVTFWLGAADSRHQEAYPVHHPKVVFNEAIMPYGVATHVGMALSWLAEN